MLITTFTEIKSFDLNCLFFLFSVALKRSGARDEVSG